MTSDSQVQQVETPTSCDMDSFLVQAMNQMTLQERERVYEEIHGCDQVIVETPDFVQDKINFLKTELDLLLQSNNICEAKKMAYTLALEQNRDYVESDDFLLLFLRSEYFDTEKAAAKMLLFFEKKLHYFGKESLARPLRLSDLNKKGLEGLHAGHLQLLPSRDRSGRAVFCIFQNLFPENYRREIDEIQAFVYMLMSALEDVETQKRGFVVIMYHIGEARSNIDLNLLKETPLLDQWLPMRVTGFHICRDSNPAGHALGHTVLKNAGKAVRCRSRVHWGNHLECQHKLLTFGLPMDTFPITSKGDLKRAAHNKWIQRRHLKEATLASGKSFDRIDLPSRDDVLAGKGKPVQDHPGNIQLRNMVDQLLIEYMDLEKLSKDKIVLRAIKYVESTGGRFLEKDNDGYWVPTSDKDARHKVRRMFTTAVGAMSKPKTLSIRGEQFFFLPVTLPPIPRLADDNYPIAKRQRLWTEDVRSRTL